MRFQRLMAGTWAVWKLTASPGFTQAPGQGGVFSHPPVPLRSHLPALSHLFIMPLNISPLSMTRPYSSTRILSNLAKSLISERYKERKLWAQLPGESRFYVKLYIVIWYFFFYDGVGRRKEKANCFAFHKKFMSPRVQDLESVFS